jgi:hypothetical protein
LPAEWLTRCLRADCECRWRSQPLLFLVQDRIVTTPSPTRNAAGREETARGPSQVTSSKLLWTVAGVGLGLFGLLLLLGFGKVTGEEFSPISFQRRDYSFFQLPLVGWQVTPVWRDNRTPELEQQLKRRNLLARRPGASRWDAVWVVAEGGYREGDPMILTRYLDTRQADDKPRWLVWSDDHPKLAQALWPAVQEAAWLEAYVLVPELFELAERATDADGFQQQLATRLTQGLVELAEQRLEADQTQEAVRIYDALLQRKDLDATTRQRIERRRREVPPDSQL